MLCKSMDWFLYDTDLRDERSNGTKVRWLERQQISHKSFEKKVRYRSWPYYDKAFSMNGIKKSNKLFAVV